MRLEKLKAALDKVSLVDTHIDGSHCMEKWEDGGDLEKIKIGKTIDKNTAQNYWSRLFGGSTL